ncbi:MAG TPA: hypothetical protein ENK18_20080 [Deltaproteobacteria bacterium]|nr:hypothetical protein [Deltaproteobacteria bacterium]
MLYDALFTLDLPQEVGPPLATGFWDGLERFLFLGSWARRMATTSVSNAAVLAGTYAAMRRLGQHPTLEVTDDAGELLDLSAVPEDWGGTPDPIVDLLPPRWTTEPCDFRLRASWSADGFATVIVVRHTPRHDAEQTAVVGSVRVLWVPEALGPELVARLERPGAPETLARLLRIHGERLSDELLHLLQEHPGGQGAHRGKIVIPLEGEGPGGFQELWRGFPDEAIEAVPVIRDALSGWWPALSPDGIEGRVRDGQFVPVAEVTHAM